MSIKESAGLLMYRYGKQGLEIFLINQTEKKGDEVSWEIPKGYLKELKKSDNGLTDQDFIALEEIQNSEQEMMKSWAFEDESNEYFELPLQAILGKNESPLQLRRKHKYIMEKGCYFVFKEAVKKVFPEQVDQIKELQEILTVRNMIKYI